VSDEDKATQPSETMTQQAWESFRKGTEVFPQASIEVAPADFTPSAPAAMVDGGPTPQATSDGEVGNAGGGDS
jgi:hypothetical protein